MAGAPQTLTALRDLSSLCSICLVCPSPLCLSELNLIKLFTLTMQQQLWWRISCDTVPTLPYIPFQESLHSEKVVLRIKGRAQTNCNPQ